MDVLIPGRPTCPCWEQLGWRQRLTDSCKPWTLAVSLLPPGCPGCLVPLWTVLFLSGLGKLYCLHNLLSFQSCGSEETVCLHLLIGGGRFVKSIPGVCWWSWDHKVTGWAVQWDLLRSGSYPPCLGKVSQGRLSRTISSWVLSISSTSLGTFLQWWAAPCHRAASVSHSFTALPLAALQLSSDNSTEDNLSVHPVLFIFFLLVCVWSLCFFPTPFFCTARRVCRMALRQTSSPAF